MLLERIRQALERTYEIESDLGGGGMGRVFLGRDLALNRRVAIKVVRPELATAAAVERFAREARVLALLQHPNIVTVHQAGTTDGLFYLVMDYLEGGTLADRLAQGPLSREEAVAVGVAVLSALEAAHARGIIHRDIKPSNVFLHAGRAVLADFGIASGPATETLGALTRGPIGTPGYMAPEQAAGGTPSTASDLYAVGAVIFEALTGRRWLASSEPEHADWDGVPRELAAVLRRALAWSPRERWTEAGAFRHALSARRKSVPRRLAGPAVVAVAVVVLLARLLTGDHSRAAAGEPPFDLAILPFDVVGAPDTSELGWLIAQLATVSLADMPELRVAPARLTLRWWTRAGESVSLDAAQAHRALRTATVAAGTLLRRGDSLTLMVTLRDSTGRNQADFDLHGRAQDPLQLARVLARELMTRLQRRIAGPPDRFAGVRWDVLREWLLGEYAFHADDWEGAESHYEAALRLDTTFAQAWWGLTNARRWLPGRPEPDLARLGSLDRRSLTGLDSTLIAAYAWTGERRLLAYQQARDSYPHDAYAELLYGDELLHRGPLFGRGLDDAADALLEAGRKDPRLSPAHEHAAWALIRLGRQEEAAAALNALEGSAGRVAVREQPDYPALMRQAYVERFDPDAAAMQRQQLIDVGIHAWPKLLVFTARAGLAFDVPSTQRALGAELASRRAASAVVRANALQAEGLALLAMGRAADALPRLEAAAGLFGGEVAEARLQIAEWVVIPDALGWPLLEPERIRQAVTVLEQAAVRGGHAGARAAWALAFHALAAGDTVGGREWRVRLSADSSRASRPLSVLLEAESQARAGNPDSALALSSPLLDYSLLRRTADPFFRSALYLRRGEWWQAMAQPDSAERAWLWGENMDILDWLDGPAEPVEVDWVIGVFASYHRALGALQRGDTHAGCRHVDRLRRYWSEAEAPTAALLREVVASAERRCGR
jgi:tRNA A-37 threonylcarbamoyl transferase component Bud32